MNPIRAHLDKQPGEMSSMFDTVAPRYDLLNDLLTFGEVRHWRTLVRDAIAPVPAETILDVAAGTGTSSIPLLEAGATVFPLDLTEAMLSVGRRQYPQLNFVAGDALHLPFQDASFDVVTISFGLRNVENPYAALTEFFRVTKPGGRLVVMEFSTPTQRLFQRVYRGYLSSLLPLISTLSTNASAYQYLVESILNWPNQRDLAAMISRAGWTGCEWKSISHGITAIHRARKP